MIRWYKSLHMTSYPHQNKKLTSLIILCVCVCVWARARVHECVSKSFRTGRLERELEMVRLSVTRCSCIAILWVSLVSFAAIILYVASQRVFIFVSVYFVIDAVRTLLDIPSYMYLLCFCVCICICIMYVCMLVCMYVSETLSYSGIQQELSTYSGTEHQMAVSHLEVPAALPPVSIVWDNS
jgi:hypothetical protein